MRLKGFSLAEMLITMSIIGSVAALTIPMLVNNAQRADIESRYAKIVDDIRNANRILMAERETTSLMTACNINNRDSQWTQSNNYLRALTRVYKIKGGINTRAVSYNSIAANVRINPNTSWYYMTSNGHMALFPRGVNDFPDMFQVFIDLNGPTRGPNLMGRDLHFFVVDKDSGNIAGYGSSQAAPFRQGGHHVADRSSTSCNENRISKAFTCTGSITDNGGRIVYDLNRL